MKEEPLVTLSSLIQKEEMEIAVRRYPVYQDPKALPILIDGGVGDTIMSIPLVEKIWTIASPVEIYARHASVFNRFKYSHIKEAKQAPVPPYTWFLTLNAVGRLITMDGFTGFRHPGMESIWEFQRAQFDRFPELRMLVAEHPRRDGALARFARKKELDRRSFGFFSLGLTPEKTVRRVSKKKSAKYITIHDGYEVESGVNGRATKTWDWHHWFELVQRLRKKYPGYEIIQLGSRTSRAIDGVTECLINRTSILEAFDVLSESSLHIDGDSGLVHAATTMQVPCVVMFGPTPAHFYGYPENKNLTSNFCPDACYWTKLNWLSKCPIELSTPRCMDEITVDQVFQSIECLLRP